MLRVSKAAICCTTTRHGDIYYISEIITFHVNNYSVNYCHMNLKRKIQILLNSLVLEKIVISLDNANECTMQFNVKVC